MEVKPYTAAVILAAGCGSRFSKDKTKQKAEILGKTVLERCLLAFDDSELVDEIVVVFKAGEEDFVSDCCKFLKKKFSLVAGGSTRAASARAGFNSLTRCDTVLIHDAARCLILPEEIDKITRRAYECGAATAALLLSDTVKELKDGKIVSTVPREKLVTVQTPQAFSYEAYRRALDSSPDDDARLTDDNMRIEALGIPIEPVFIGKYNIKITHTSDLTLAEYIIKTRNNER